MTKQSQDAMDCFICHSTDSQWQQRESDTMAEIVNYTIDFIWNRKSLINTEDRAYLLYILVYIIYII